MFTARQLRNTDMAMLRRVQRQQEMSQQQKEAQQIIPKVPLFNKVNPELFNQGNFLGMQSGIVGNYSPKQMVKPMQTKQMRTSVPAMSMNRLRLQNKRGGRY